MFPERVMKLCVVVRVIWAVPREGRVLQETPVVSSSRSSGTVQVWTVFLRMDVGLPVGGFQVKAEHRGAATSTENSVVLTSFVVVDYLMEKVVGL